MNEILAAMAEHTRDNPTHGYNCACKDILISRAREEIVQHPEWYDEFCYLGAVLMRDTHLSVTVLKARGILQ